MTKNDGRLRISQTAAEDMAKNATENATENAAKDEELGYWQQGELVEVTITDLNHDGAGVGRYEGRVVFVPDTVVGDRLVVRLVRVKPTYGYGKPHEWIEDSPHRVRPSCIVADKCGGCQWQHVDYDFQLTAKRNQIIQDLERIGGFSNPPVDPVLAIGEPLGYRNKATYPLRRVADSDRSLRDGGRTPVLRSPSSRSPSYSVQAGYYQKGSHQLINLNQCPIQDARLNPLLSDLKHDIAKQQWRIYDEATHRGELRHLGLRIGRRTGEILVTLVATEGNLPRLATQAENWLKSYHGLVGVLLNRNPKRTNVILGPTTECVAGRPYLNEVFAGLTFQLRGDTFFQVNTEQAEALLEAIALELQLTGNEVLLDAYCGIGTLTLPLAKQVKQAIALELQPEAIAQAQLNAELNGITNVEFHVGAVEDLLPRLDIASDVVLLDPPRKGCAPEVIEALCQMHPARIVYVSCNPSTLARDLKLLRERGNYRLTRVQPADFFPQTGHVECAAFLQAT